MGFPQSVADDVLVRCGRHCCLCGVFAGPKIELHHIKQAADGGDDSAENCIPLCLNCHAEVKSYNIKHPKGRMYTEKELKGHRDKFYAKYSLIKDDIIENINAEMPKFTTSKTNKLVKWGYSEQDICCPLLPGSIVLIAGYAGSNKSTYVQHIVNRNIECGQKVAYCCLRDNPFQICIDIIAEAAHIDANKMKRGMMTAEKWEKLMLSRAKINEENLIFLPYDKSSKCSDILSLVETVEADIVVIDDFNGIIYDSPMSVEPFLYELRNVAGLNDTIIFCVYNLNMPKNRMDMRPTFSDFPADYYYRLFDIVQIMFEPRMHYNVDDNEKDIIEVINLKGALKNPCTFRMISPESITGVFSIETSK